MIFNESFLGIHLSTSFSRLWAFRGFILSSVKREFQLRYHNSALGIFWIILSPLSMILIYTLIFSEVMHARMPGIEMRYGYSIYLMAGLLPWGLFSEMIGKGQNLFLDNANLLKKVNFPKISLLVILCLSSLINFSIIYSIFLIFLIISGQFPGLVIFSVIPILVLQIILAIGLALILGILNVFFRDVGQFFGIFLQFWFWLTPIIYVFSMVPSAFQGLISLNPMTPIIVAYQNIFVLQSAPNWISLLPVLATAVALNLIGLYLFKKRSGEMVDEL